MRRCYLSSGSQGDVSKLHVRCLPTQKAVQQFACSRFAGEGEREREERERERDRKKLNKRSGKDRFIEENDLVPTYSLGFFVSNFISNTTIFDEIGLS